MKSNNGSAMEVSGKTTKRMIARMILVGECHYRGRCASTRDGQLIVVGVGLLVQVAMIAQRTVDRVVVFAKWRKAFARPNIDEKGGTTTPATKTMTTMNAAACTVP